jgi:hypothetical protein
MTKPEKTTGFICLHRSIRDHWIYKDDRKLRWWLEILMECNHTDQKVSLGFELVDCRRGQSLNSLKTWSKLFRVDVSTVRRFFSLLEDDKMITIENVVKTTRLTVCNYDSYNGNRHATQSQSNRDTISKQSQSNTNNNANNDNNVNNEQQERERYAPHEIEDFRKFQKWIDATAPRVAEMKYPFTIQQFLEIKGMAPAEMVRDVLKAMHNRSDLLKKNLSANLTFRNWLKREQNGTSAKVVTIPAAKLGTSEARIAVAKDW